jgi:hypothetical protein
MYEFIQVSAEIFVGLNTAWRAQLDDQTLEINRESYEGQLGRVRDWVFRPRSDEERDYWYAVVGAETKEVKAIASLGHARGAWAHAAEQASLRVLAITVEPNLDAGNRDPDPATLAHVAATVVVGGLKLTRETLPSRQLKIWCSFPLDREFMESICNALKLYKELGIESASSHRNWLVVELSKNGAK